MARLSTHVLDTTRGLPAAGLQIHLHRLEPSERVLVATVTTNADGRTDTPLLSGDAIPTGRYELTFHAGAYLRGLGLSLPEPAFLDEIVIRFGIADAAANYHVPLLLSPHAYSTYRGS
jgi:5-hydroxyisourate hydrolase